MSSDNFTISKKVFSSVKKPSYHFIRIRTYDHSFVKTSIVYKAKELKKIYQNNSYLVTDNNLLAKWFVYMFRARAKRLASQKNGVRNATEGIISSSRNEKRGVSRHQAVRGEGPEWVHEPGAGRARGGVGLNNLQRRAATTWAQTEKVEGSREKSLPRQWVVGSSSEVAWCRLQGRGSRARFTSPAQDGMNPKSFMSAATVRE